MTNQTDKPNSPQVKSGQEQTVPNPTLVNKVPTWFWVLSVVALLWNLMGLSIFLMQTLALETLIEGLTDEQKALYKNMPMWAIVGFGIGVVAGVLGCIGLLLRKRWAFPILVLSLIGVLIQQTYMYFFSDSIRLMGGPSAMIMPMFVLAVAIGLIFFSKLFIGKRWFR